MNWVHRTAGAIAIALCIHAGALETNGRVGELNYSVYAPDWTWQKRDINVLVVIDNTGNTAADVTLELEFPPGHETDFGYEIGDAPHDTAFPAVTKESVAPGGEVREAFTGITARDGVPLQTYPFTIIVRAQGDEAKIPYNVTTIRGAAISPGKWALYLPAGVALVWSVVFVLVLSRMASPGAWKTPSPPVDMEGDAS